MDAEIIIYLLVLVFPAIRGDGFIGGGMGWRRVGNTTAVDVIIRNSWQHGATVTTKICSASDVSSQTMFEISPHAIICEACGGPTDVTVAPNTELRCTDANTGTQWNTGMNVIRFDPGIRAPVYIVTKNYEWTTLIGLNLGASHRSEYATGTDTIVRPDTNEVNQPPVIATLPEVLLKAGCDHSIRIPVSDDDRDTVRCSFPTDDEQCGAICSARHAGITLTTDCVLNVASTVPAGAYGIPIIIYDSPLEAPLSLITHQFVLRLYPRSTGMGCDPISTYTRRYAKCWAYPADEPIRIVVAGKTNDASVAMTALRTVSPSGSSLSAVTHSANTGESVISVELQAISYIGSHMFCYQADFSSTPGAEAEMRCLALVIGGKTPQVQSVSPPPSAIPEGTPMNVFDITFDEKVLINPDERNVSLVRISPQPVGERELFLVADVLTFPNGDAAPYIARITFPSSVVLRDDARYHVGIEAGFVTSDTHCGIEVPAREWIFYRLPKPETTTTTVTSTATTTATSTDTTTATSTDTTTATSTDTTTATSTDTTTATSTDTTTDTSMDTTKRPRTTPRPVLPPKKKSKCSCSCNCDPEINVKKAKRKRSYKKKEYCGK